MTRIVTNTRPFLLCPSCGSAMKLVRIVAPNPLIFVCLYCNHLEEASQSAPSEDAKAGQHNSRLHAGYN